MSSTRQQGPFTNECFCGRSDLTARLKRIVSRALFMMFVCSRQVMDILGIVCVKAIIQFARENVLPHVERMYCGQEGTNNEMKNCSSTVMPQNWLDPAIATLHLKANIKAANTSIKVCKNSIPKNCGPLLPLQSMLQTPLLPLQSMLQTPAKACYRLSGFIHLIAFPIKFHSTNGLLIHRFDSKML
jgi:hypothetical protein